MRMERKGTRKDSVKTLTLIAENQEEDKILRSVYDFLEKRTLIRNCLAQHIGRAYTDRHLKLYLYSWNVKF